ncbi:hypothetical protein ACQ9AT_23490 [Klebsiella pneumoniae]|uniref:hypothetical protein n=1 Tax=Klebsiella pneumoniae TaxID=573 RepID=UPI001D0E4697|nr:hypothetical protein [Klebsiella pneumoniae]
MNISTVNELIQSLESAGELSIREQKFLKLAKAYQQLAAENVELKEDRDILARYWIEDGGDEDCAMSYCESTPATDRIVAGIKADGVESGIKTIMTILNHQAPGVSDAINVLRVHSSELREGADK